MKQVLVIHGAGSFAHVPRADFVAELRKREVTLESLRRGADWKANLRTALGPDFDVLQPRMPDADSPWYDAWEAWFEQIVPLLDDEVILIGHSLGGLFLAKYLSEKDFPKKILATALVAAPYTGPEENIEERIRKANWNLGGDLSKFAAQSPKIILVHSDDDPTVPFRAMERFAEKLPQAQQITLHGQGHIRGESLPELETELRKL